MKNGICGSAPRHAADRRVGFLLVMSALAIWSLCGGSIPARAEDCFADPSLSTVPECVLLSPTGALAYKVTIVACSGPVQGVVVEVRFDVPGDTLVCWCSATPDPGLPPMTHSFFATTNSSGIATFNIRGGGCIEKGLAAIPGARDMAGEIFADGIKMQEFGTTSPDAVDAAGRLPTSTSSLWDPAGYCATGLADAVQHTTPLAFATYQWCSDLNCDGACGVTDAVILTPYLAGSATCPGDAGATP